MSETRASEASDEPLIGATINGRYRVISLIARGGMGKVFKAEQSALGRTCALKVLSPKYQGDRDPEFHRRFTLEAATASKLNHPNTVTIFDHGKCEQHGVYFIAMEYLNGRTLHQVLHTERILPELRANRIAQQICRSVAQAHSLGVVHRDLKPGNVMLLEREDEQDVVKVLDFGLVKDVSGEHEELTQTGLFMGSPKYMSPEQITGDEVSPRSDVYALGVILYEMLCGKVPFDKKASMSTLMAHMKEPPPPMAEVNPAAILSKPMESVVMRCLEKDPEKRFSSMRELLNALKRVAGDVTSTYESLPQISIDALLGKEGASSGRGSDPRGPNTAPPPSGSGAVRVNSALTSSSAIDSLSPPPSPPTFTGALSSPRGPAFRTYAVALVAALLGGGLTLALAKRSVPSPSAPTAPEASALVPAPVPSPANDGASASNQLRLVRIESEPSGATVSDRGTEVCMATPCEIVWRGDAAKVEHRLNLSKRGFKSGMLVVSLTDERVFAKLDTAPAGWQPPPVDTAQAASAPAPSVQATASAIPEPAVATAAPTAVPAVVAPTAEPSAKPTTAPAVPAVPEVMRFEEGMSRPVRISGRDPIYTREALETKVQGTVIAKCIITTAGTLSGCRIIKSLPHMDEAVLAALASQRYQPIVYQGRPVNVDYVFTMKMVPPP